MQRFRAEGGLSLLEVVVALALLTLFILPLVSLLNSGLVQIQKSKSFTEATALLQAAVEGTKLIAANEWETIAKGKLVINSPNPNYQISTETFGADPDLRRVVLEVLTSDGGPIAGGQVRTEILLYRSDSQ